MTEQFKKELTNSLEDELSDVTKYCDMSKEAEELGMTCESKIFRDISREEYIHAKHLKEIIKENKISVSEETEIKIEKLWKKANEAHDEL